MLSQRVNSRAKGFTLIELLTTVTMLAILVTLAAPSFNNTIRDNRVLAASNSLVAAVANARSEALRRGRMVSICPSANGTSCSTDWSQGWMVYVENTSVTTGATPVVDTVLQVELAPNGLQLVQSTGNKWIRFSTRGIAEAAVSIDVKPSTCNSGYKYQTVAFGIAGRPLMTKQTC